MLETLLNRVGNTPELTRRLFATINLALLAGLAIELALLTWQLVPRPPAPTIATTRTPETAERPPMVASRPTSWDLARWHLFGEFRPQAAPARPVARQELPETRLNLTLRGVVSAEAGQGGGAIIDSGNGQEVYYPVGAELPGGARLQAVRKDHVVLERNGRLETLKLPKDGIAPPTAGGRRPSSRPAAARQSVGGPALARLRQEVIENPSRLLDVFSIAPQTRHGRFVGYRIRPGRDRDLFALTGLKDGDTVTAINGVRLDTPAKAMNALRGLAQASVALVEIERDGRMQTLRVDLGR